MWHSSNSLNLASAGLFRGPLRSLLRPLLAGALLVLCLSPASAPAQFLDQAAPDGFRDTTVLRPPADAKVALIVFEDLGCPACARAHPYELAAIAATHVPLLRYDFPLAAHVWTFDGAVLARYIQDRISPQLASQFRSDVFAQQMSISSKDDIRQFAAEWLRKHGHVLPADYDADGKAAAEVNADLALGKRLNVEYTPTVVVVTRTDYQTVCGTRTGTNDPAQILPVLQAAIARSK